MAKTTGKTVVVCFRIDPTLKLDIAKKAEKLGVTIADYCQMKVLAEPATAKSEPKPEPKKQPVPKAPTGVTKKELNETKIRYNKAVKELIKQISETRFERLANNKQPEFRRLTWERFQRILKGIETSTPKKR